MVQNLLQIQDQLKGLPDVQLKTLAQQPRQDVPPFLVLGELDRRQRMRVEAADNSRGQSSTVAQDLVGGLTGGMAVGSPSAMATPPVPLSPGAPPYGAMGGGISDLQQPIGFADGGQVLGGRILEPNWQSEEWRRRHPYPWMFEERYSPRLGRMIVPPAVEPGALPRRGLGIEMNVPETAPVIRPGPLPEPQTWFPSPPTFSQEEPVFPPLFGQEEPDFRRVERLAPADLSASAVPEVRRFPERRTDLEQALDPETSFSAMMRRLYSRVPAAPDPNKPFLTIEIGKDGAAGPGEAAASPLAAASNTPYTVAPREATSGLQGYVPDVTRTPGVARQTVDPYAGTLDELRKAMAAQRTAQEGLMGLSDKQIGDLRQQAEEQREFDRGMALLNLGFGMAAGTSPNFLENVAAGGVAATKSLSDYMKNQRAYTKSIMDAETAKTAAQSALAGGRIDDAVKLFTAQLGLERIKASKEVALARRTGYRGSRDVASLQSVKQKLLELRSQSAGEEDIKRIDKQIEDIDFEIAIARKQGFGNFGYSVDREAGISDTDDEI